jgi:hypothetical protein
MFVKSRGQPWAVGEASIILDIYSHLLPDMQEKAAKALEDALR